MSDQGTRRQPTWIEVAVSNAGMMKGATAITWAWCWGITREILKHDPSVEEVAEYWNASVRTAYRDHAAFRKAFPMLDSPAPYVDNPAILPIIKRASKRMADFENNIKSRRRPTDVAAMKIGFVPFGV
jgi:hypothetical protein